MTSNKQIEANRKNSKKGGIKTERGKEISKHNALKHGLNSSIYDWVFEEKLIEEYKVKWSLEKILIMNICISEARYERGVTLEYELLKSIVEPSRVEKVYDSEKEYDNYVNESHCMNDAFENLNVFLPQEPSYIYQKVEWWKFEYDLEKVQYLTDVIWKYNYQNEIRLNKNITSLLQFINR